jgi:ABC-type transport system involved in multi-copper enzyme maturation permease subunit
MQRKLSKIDKVFYKCVDALQWTAKKTNLSYEEINVIVFCAIWPAVTGLLAYKAFKKKK